MNFTAYKITIEGKNVVFETNATPYYLNQIKDSLNGKIKVTCKDFKESKTQRQNNYIWALFNLISLEVNGSKRQEDVNRVYRDVLILSNVLHEKIQAPIKSKHILERVYSIVLEGEIKDDMQVFDCFIGISQMNTKEMAELIESTIDYGVKLGIAWQQLDSMKGGYDL